MDDEETVALIAGGHTFGKTHGAGDATLVGPRARSAAIEQQGLGWKSSSGTGKGGDAITSGLEVIWTTTPTKWSNNFFANLFKRMGATKPGRARTGGSKRRRRRRYRAGASPVETRLPLADHDSSLRFDPGTKRSRGASSTPEQFPDAFARAWFKLTHRDIGPLSRLCRPYSSPKESLLWQDPIPAVIIS